MKKQISDIGNVSKEVFGSDSVFEDLLCKERLPGKKIESVEGSDKKIERIEETDSRNLGSPIEVTMQVDSQGKRQPTRLIEVIEEVRVPMRVAYEEVVEIETVVEIPTIVERFIEREHKKEERREEEDVRTSLVKKDSR